MLYYIDINIEGLDAFRFPLLIGWMLYYIDINIKGLDAFRFPLLTG